MDASGTGYLRAPFDEIRRAPTLFGGLAWPWWTRMEIEGLGTCYILGWLAYLLVGLISMLDAGGRNFRVSKVRARTAFMYKALIVYGLIADLPGTRTFRIV